MSILGHAARAMAVTALSVVAISAGVDALATRADAGSGTPWPVYHGDLQGSGVASGPTTYHGARAAWTSRPVHGQIYGEPLVVGSEVVVATENDYVYALSATTGKRLWATKVGTPVLATRLPCGDIRPDVGITSTPVVDTARSEIFVVADEWSRAHHQISHHLVGLRLTTGAVLLDQVVDPAGTTPAAQLQRAALTLDGGRVIVASGGNAGDCSTYHGWI
ncbi:MAG TPA: PQQ-binding-like beta-propeller repeat protein, partial [Acidimicrobiales bacterium]|nr:PQQ-binding-like beta-propeller repeat protein [Acidimicrobiales bacterium]